MVIFMLSVFEIYVLSYGFGFHDSRFKVFILRYIL
jgi:hypothetical protein